MGSQIALQAALFGCEVVLCGRDAGRIEHSMQSPVQVLQRRVDKGKLAPEEFDSALDRVHSTCDWTELAHTELIVESASEDRTIKRDVLTAIAEHAGPDAIIGSNSSTLPSSLFAQTVSNPARLLNIHFYNPALVMPLVEIVRGPHTSDAVVNRSLEFASAIGKTPVRVEKESYGFLANRMLFIAMREAFMLAQQGYISISDCDDAVKRALRWPMGPFELADLIGLDVVQAILEEGVAQTGDDHWSVPEILARRVEKGDLGRKTGSGFYSAESGG